MSKIAWLASYPKSGNTWVRIFVDNYRDDQKAPVDINHLEEGLHAGSRALFERLTGLESTELTPQEIDRVRPAMYRQWAMESDDLLFVKVHDAWHSNDRDQPLFPPEATALVLYIVRNPLDIVASFANHYTLSRDEAIATMGNTEYALAASAQRARAQLRQFVGDWSGHALSWLESSGLPAHVLRYEDLAQAPKETFAGLLQATGMALDEERLDKAIRFSSFRQLRDHESRHGFRERLAASDAFFRRGKPGGWREELTPAQAARVIEQHGPVMRRFGYL